MRHRRFLFTQAMATLEELQAELAQLKTAISAAYTGAEYEISDGQTKRRLKRADLKLLLARKAELDTAVERLGGGRVTFGMPVDSPRGPIF